MFKTEIAIKDDATKERLEVICKNIQLKDVSFIYVFEKGKYSWVAWTLIVSSTTKNNAFRRGGWLTKATGIEGLHYVVREETKS